MDKKFNFIQLPKSEVMLAEEEQSYLLGGANCRPYTSCPKEYLNHCYYDDSPCAGTGGCGGDFHCDHSCFGHDFTIIV